MSRVWEARKQVFRRQIQRYARDSQVLSCVQMADLGVEWRTVLRFDTKTLVLDKDGKVTLAGPVFTGIRYHERFLSEAPHPMSLACVLEPLRIFHPNCEPTGAMCLGRPQAGVCLELILNQIWAGLMFNMQIVNTRNGEFVNYAAVRYVRDRVSDFPISDRGLLEATCEDFQNGIWQVPAHRRTNATFDPEGDDHGDDAE